MGETVKKIVVPKMSKNDAKHISKSSQHYFKNDPRNISNSSQNDPKNILNSSQNDPKIIPISSQNDPKIIPISSQNHPKIIPEVVFSALLRSSIFGNTWVILGVHYIFGLWGLVFESFGNLRIQARMQIFVFGALFHQKRIFLISFRSWECRNRA